MIADPTVLTEHGRAMTAPDDCPDCDENAPHGANTEEEMDVDDDEAAP